jgi:hypothetical protein
MTLSISRMSCRVLQLGRVLRLAQRAETAYEISIDVCPKTGDRRRGDPDDHSADGGHSADLPLEALRSGR